MSDKYHVGLGVFGIYAGTLKNKEEWKDKSEVTREAIDALGEKPEVWTGCDYELGCAKQYDLDKLAIEAVPPAQASPCEFCKHNDVAADGICLRCMAERRTDERSD